MSRLRYSLFALALILCASNVQAQVPRPPARDTSKVVRDTTQQKADTLAQQRDTAHAALAFADSVHPIPQMPQPYLGPSFGFSDGVWVWDRNAFKLEATSSLADLLDRIPGILTMRSGLYLQPIAATYVGATANRLEVFLDGYQLDPLLEGSVDLSKIELSNIDNVRVERHLGRIRIYIQTLTVRDNRPYSSIEAGVGQPNANVFRGLFMAPKLFFGPVGFALDRIDTNGSRGDQPANQVAGWLKWSYIRSRAGLEVEYRRNQTARDPNSPWPDHYIRNDLMVRGRAQLTSSIVAEAFGGRTHLDLADTIAQRTDSVPHLKAEDTQFGGRVSFESPFVWANGAARFRSNTALPSTQIDAAGGVRYNILSARADITQSNWRDAGNASELTLQAQAGPFHGLKVFGETTTSHRGANFLLRLPDTAIITSYKGYRVGAELAWHGIDAGVAMLHVTSDSIPSFALPFDTMNARFFGASSTGWEISGRVPLPLLHGFSAEGTVTDWRTGNVSIYMPTRQFRAGLEYYAIPLKSGNLEMLGRIEMIHRGAMLVPARTTDETGQPTTLTTVPQVDYFDAYAEIRIIDVRAFVRYEDLSGQRVQQVIGRPIPGPRMIYGVKWQFFN